ncbi:hypothetical protein HXX76_014619 [Chlamydomonas incerta]|uniref:Protein kinase domain-containing protein n=1 Tax=Chlamydomonas incerta TaxID=51695 RepID=A0A835SPG2_CHLIN|nr:hypothetical protein HXX76_014619 [Chlamydomonas incerta]|eukprot:KAG2424410.1 hypothetical protein HXX76_014619 [Chlamydomonas incerta]
MGTQEPVGGARARVELTDVVLGWGRSSTVRLGRYFSSDSRSEDADDPAASSGRLCAVKLLHPSWCYEHKDRVVREIEHLCELSVWGHPFIVRMLDVELLPGGLALIMEYQEGVQTLDKLQETHGGRLPQSVARELFQQLMIAMEFCHRIGLSNRDCKITDLLVRVCPSSGDVRLQLADFSFAKDADKDEDSNPMAQHGSALFAAPEVITASHAARYAGAKADIWSCGVVLCTLLFGCHPHLAAADLDAAPGDQILLILQNAVAGRIMVPREEAAAQPEAYALMAAMLTVNPAARPDATAVLGHPWMRAGLGSGAAPELAELNSGLLADGRLRAEAAARGAEVRGRVAGLLDSLLGVAAARRR